MTISPGGSAMETVNLRGRKRLILGIANEHSLAWAAAQHFRSAGRNSP